MLCVRFFELCETSKCSLIQSCLHTICHLVCQIALPLQYIFLSILPPNHLLYLPSYGKFQSMFSEIQMTYFKILQIPAGSPLSLKLVTRDRNGLAAEISSNLLIAKVDEIHISTTNEEMTVYKSEVAEIVEAQNGVWNVIWDNQQSNAVNQAVYYRINISDSVTEEVSSLHDLDTLALHEIKLLSLETFLWKSWKISES